MVKYKIKLYQLHATLYYNTIIWCRRCFKAPGPLNQDKKKKKIEVGKMCHLIHWLKRQLVHVLSGVNRVSFHKN